MTEKYYQGVKHTLLRLNVKVDERQFDLMLNDKHPFGIMLDFDIMPPTNIIVYWIDRETAIKWKNVGIEIPECKKLENVNLNKPIYNDKQQSETT